MLHKLVKRGHANKKTRVGRGYGSAHGGHTSLKGQKGQKSRSGGKIPTYFEGGQLPFVRRLPHIRGFKNQYKKSALLIKTSLLNEIEAKTFSADDLVKIGFISKIPEPGIKILKDVEVTKPIKVKGFLYSKTAKLSIEKAGGTAE